jgi:AraC-like DNA-binding protein/mannose-6-phosphate isomerase-like protein (cupin superfamily)
VFRSDFAIGDAAVTYPLELREKTDLRNSTYPLNVFHNRCPHARQGSVVLFLHWHEHFEIIVMKAGRAVFHIDGKSYEAEPGDVLIVPAGGLHAGYSAIDGSVEYFAIVFNAALLQNQAAHDPAHTQFVAPYLEGTVRFPVKLGCSDDSHAICVSLLERAISEFKTKDRAYELAVKSYLYLLFALLARRYLPEALPRKTPAVSSRYTDRFKTLLHHLGAHYAEPITVEQAAKLVNLNPFHFCKTFKKATGATFVEYMNRLRMDEAERLLEETDLTVTEIAGRVGCGNANYFTKRFKQIKGIAPSQLRKHSPRG